MRTETLLIPDRFRGPPMSGNGGYVCGLLAEKLWQCQAAQTRQQPHLAVEVTLRSPVPLDQPLQLQLDADQAQLLYVDKLVADARLCELQMEIPTPPTWDQAWAQRAASTSLIEVFPGRKGIHPTCFCCGAELAPEDGLHVYAAPIPGFHGVAAAWQPHANFGDAEGWLPPEHIWTALDCPGMGAFVADNLRVGLLGRMAARIVKPVNVRDRNLVIGWPISIEGRKHFAGTAVFNGAGELCAYAKATWIGGPKA